MNENERMGWADEDRAEALRRKKTSWAYRHTPEPESRNVAPATGMNSQS